MLGLLDDARDRVLILCHRLVPPTQRDLAFAANDGERRAQLVADVGEESAPCLVDLAQRLVRLMQLLGAFRHLGLEIGVGALQRLLVRLEVVGHAIEALAEIGELVAPGNGDAMREIALGKHARAAQQLGERGAEPLKEQHHQRERDQDGKGRMNLTDPLKPAQQPRGIGIDPDDLGGLVGDRDLDQLVQLLVDAALEQSEQRRPGDIGAAAAAQLLHLAELIERVLKFALDGVQPVELGGFHPPLLGADHSELGLGEPIQLGEIGLDDLVQVSGSEGRSLMPVRSVSVQALNSCWLCRESCNWRSNSWWAMRERLR